ncbi:S1 family peptidase [Pseudarthrobacter enclensis]|uniref:S1 family peptidase n=1 Tax=Pseudarthrobacter enclensis TaxID=993070 RepID=UPI003EE21404
MTAARRAHLVLGAATGILLSATCASPAMAGDGSATTPALAQAAPAAPVQSTSGPSDAALADAALRDLGLTREQFAAAGERGASAAAAANRLRGVPGYAGIRLDGGHIVVTGSGAELLAGVAALAPGIPDIAVEAPRAVPESGHAAPKSGTVPQLAGSTEQLFQAYVRDVGPHGLQAVMAADGKFIIRTGAVNAPESTTDQSSGPGPEAAGDGSPADTMTTAARPGKVSPAEFVARYANVELDGAAPLASEADVPGGVGYIADTGWICSTGFSAFDPAGLPAVLSAGHCASDGQATTATLEFQFVQAGRLGSFGFSQFGGPGNSRIIEDPLDPNNPGNVGTDISVIEDLRDDLDPLPAASTWGDPSQPGPDVKIIGTADPVQGMPVCRSGRTSAWSCGTVDAVGIFVVPGPDYAADETDLRAFRGFLSYGVQSSGGDSGGPYVSGNYAVGTHAAGDAPPATVNFAVGATLSESLAVLPGYQLELFLNKPAITSPAPGATYEPGQTLTGTVAAAPASAVAAGSSVRITMQGKDPEDVPLGAAGSFSFTAPDGPGPLRFTAETINGSSRSGAVEFDFAREAPEPPAPQPPAPGGPDPEQPAPVPPVPAPAAPQPPVDGGAAVVPADAGAVPADLANTGAAGLLAASGAAVAALLAGILLAVWGRRRRQSR